MEDNFALLEKSNFWNGNIPKLGYIRNIYATEIFDYLGDRLIEVLVGQRRAGM